MTWVLQLVISVSFWTVADGALDAWPTVSAPKRSKVAMTRLADVDADYAVQGEYLGVIQTACNTRQTVGLQIVAMGNGQFSGRGQLGGLPGNGPANGPVWQWKGRRDGTVVALLGSHGRLVVQPGTALVFDGDGLEIGRLTKVQRQSQTLGAHPPCGAIVLFDGSTPSQLAGARLSADGNLAVGATTRMPVHDFRLHVEFRVPYMPYARGQGRGNSGLYLQQRYEVQVLDSFGLAPVFNGCAALYRQKAPRVNMSFPPLSWQTYDIWFTSARWDALGNKICPARITVWHNGVAVHCNQVVETKTGHGQQEGPDDKPILFQNHGNPVVYRNVWLVPLNPPTPTRVARAARHSHPLMRLLRRNRARRACR